MGTNSAGKSMALVSCEAHAGGEGTVSSFRARGSGVTRAMTCDFFKFLPPTIRPELGWLFISAIAIPITLLTVEPTASPRPLPF